MHQAPRHDGDGAVAEVAIAGHQPDLRIRHLGPPGLAAQLPHQLDDVVHPRHVRLRQQPAMRVHRQPAAEAERAALDEGAALALGAEAEILELAEHDIGEAVVDLGDVDIGRRDARHGEGARRGLGQAEPRHVRPLGDGARAVRMALRDAGDSTRGRRRSCARSAALTTTAAAPSLSRLQSSSRSGSAIIREAWWSSMVIGAVISHCR